MKRTIAVRLVFAVAAAAAASSAGAAFWLVGSGTGRITLHADLVRTLGIEARTAVRDGNGRLAIPLRLAGSLELFAPRSLFRDLAGGELRIESPAVLRLGGVDVPLQGIAVRRGPEERTVTLVDASGRPLFDGDQMHFAVDREAGRVRMFNIDLRLTAETAALLGEARYAGIAVGVLELSVDAAIPRGERPEPDGTCSSPDWGAPANDVALVNIGSVQQAAREGTFPTGRIAVVPSAMLQNVGTTDVPWYSKFSGAFPPYGNDQHPFLVWNMYRIAGGAIEQIGRSPLKHAFLTLNTDCGCPAGNVLWTNCKDTYGSGTNDSLQDVGPRDELTAHTGVWERCHSLFDPDCDGVQNAAPPRASAMDRRMAVAENDLTTPGAVYYVDAWYVVRDDTNIFNTMGHRRVAPTGGATWTFGVTAFPFTQGPVIDEWVDPAAPGPLAQSVLVDTGFGRLKLAVRVTDLGSGQWRYDYALMNLDFDARIRMFSVPLRGALATDAGFHDADQDPANDWILTASKRIAWRAPSSAAAQDYSTLLSFHFTANASPTPADGSSAKLLSQEATGMVIEPAILGPSRPARARRYSK
jgi:hypothetical protein